MHLIGQKYLQGHSPGEHEGSPAGSVTRLRKQDRGFGVLNEAILYGGLPGLAKGDGFFHTVSGARISLAPGSISAASKRADRRGSSSALPASAPCISTGGRRTR